MEGDQVSYDYMNGTETVEIISFSWMNISSSVAAIVIFLLSALLTTAIFLDRKAYEKTRAFLLLNYMFNYTLFALFFYFHNVHIHIFTDLPQSTCLFIIILTSVTNDAALYFILPICCDFIVKYFKPSKYESHSFLHIQIILTVVLWVFIWIEDLILLLAASEYESEHCVIFLHFVSLCIYSGTVILYIITMLVFVGLFIYIAVKSKECENIESRLITLIIVVTFIVLSCIVEIIFLIGIYANIKNPVYYLPFLLNMIRFVVVPFLLLFDATIRQSIRKLCSAKCKKPTSPVSHELTTELN
ncbi:uncharacterized protein LOC106869328 isoform X4 [Octopus bimaculoides]|uniref:G-protein coupled receptors family 1 profile domain-containing protein n=1 Tax=Octopus bimaculoides TaxID=37653 RepID=A0A0L8HPW3_OCTBM|nr:uncharacterized protein LOC106869328 isoform X4 [Octopus bimaculoides]